MADPNLNGSTPPDQSAAIAGLFNTEEKSDTSSSDTTAVGDTPAKVDLPEQYEPGRLPKQFVREDGKHDYEGLSKSWFDTRTALTQQQARVKELEGQLRSSDEPWEKFSADFDWDSVKQRAPNAYTGGGVDNEAAMSLLRHLHGTGLSKAKAAKAIGDYYADLDKMVGETPSADEQRKAAIAHLGTNGGTMVREVQTWLETRAAVSPFSDDEMRVLESMTRSGPALSILWRLSRSGGSAAPPNAGDTAVPVRDEAKEKAAARKSLGVSDDEWNRNKDAIIARYADTHGIDPSELRRR